MLDETLKLLCDKIYYGDGVWMEWREWLCILGRGQDTVSTRKLFAEYWQKYCGGVQSKPLRVIVVGYHVLLTTRQFDLSNAEYKLEAKEEA